MAGDSNKEALGQPSSVAQSIAATAVDARVVDCALQLFLAQGISAVKMTDIADAAGVGVATLYRHFSTKASIATAAATMLWQQLEQALEELVSSEGYQRLDGASRLELLLRTYCERQLYRPGFAALLDQLDRLMMEGAVGDDAVAVYTKAVVAPYPHFLAAYELGRSDGSISREVDFDLFYRSVAHALLSVAGKLSRGEVLPSDDFSLANSELGCISDMAIRSLRQQG